MRAFNTNARPVELASAALSGQREGPYPRVAIHIEYIDCASVRDKPVQASIATDIDLDLDLRLMLRQSVCFPASLLAHDSQDIFTRAVASLARFTDLASSVFAACGSAESMPDRRVCLCSTAIPAQSLTDILAVDDASKGLCQWQGSSGTPLVKKQHSRLSLQSLQHDGLTCALTQVSQQIYRQQRAFSSRAGESPPDSSVESSHWGPDSQQLAKSFERLILEAFNLLQQDKAELAEQLVVDGAQSLPALQELRSEICFTS